MDTNFKKVSYITRQQAGRLFKAGVCVYEGNPPTTDVVSLTLSLAFEIPPPTPLTHTIKPFSRVLYW